MTSRATILAGAALLLPAAAHAHLVNTGLGPFYDGISHFALTLEDLLPVLAIALLAGQRGTAAARGTLIALPAAWIAGGIVGLYCPVATSAPALTAASLVAAGGLVAAQARLRPALVTTLAAVLGVVHGCLNGSAMAQAKLGIVGLAGIVASLFVSVALVAALAVAIRPAWGRVALRVAGSWIVAIGLLSIGWSLRAGR